MNIDEIVNKAIPISFPGVKCAATINKEREKAIIRRDELKKTILSLLEKENATFNNAEPGMDRGTQ